jgi:hypothetical protein
MGDARRFAQRVNLAAMAPADQLASTKYCLVAAGKEYLVYAPSGEAVSLDLSAAVGAFNLEWFDTENGKTFAGQAVEGGARRELKAPFAGPGLAYLKLQGSPNR